MYVSGLAVRQARLTRAQCFYKCQENPILFAFCIDRCPRSRILDHTTEVLAETSAEGFEGKCSLNIIEQYWAVKNISVIKYYIILL
jgi:hypothetical protein